VSTGVDDLLVTVAAGGLPGSLREFPDAELPDAEAVELVRAAAHHGIAGFMLASVRECRLRLPPSAIEALHHAQLQEWTTRLYVEQELLSVSGLLDAAEIDFRVLDACAVAHLDYRDPDVRAVTRLDLLVHPRTIGPAADVLRRCGWRPPKVPDGRIGGVAFVGPSGPRLVLHDDIDATSEMSVDLGQVWADGDPMVVSGRKIKALGSEQRLLYTSALAVDADEAMALLPQRDLAEMVLFGAWRRRRLMDLAVSWNAEQVLAGAVDAAWRRLAIADVTNLSVWAEGYRAEARKNLRRHSAGGSDQRAHGRSWAMLRARLTGPS
jgi:hypothetical protein